MNTDFDMMRTVAATTDARNEEIRAAGHHDGCSTSMAPDGSQHADRSAARHTASTAVGRSPTSVT
ncbi:hypothetical protein A5714_09345 [Mycobacterium sp. E2462]|nr:hypothetical protein A5714_09345 [Mycobacterium sp. E2462]